MGNLSKKTTEIKPANIQQEAEAAIKKLENELKELRKNIPQTISTDVKYEGVMISKLEKVENLLQVSSSVMSKFERYEIEKERYTVNNGVLSGANLAEYKIENLSKSEWVAVIEKALFELRNKVEIQKRESMIAELQNFVSEEEKVRKAYENVMSKYGTLN